ncbi:hypothetical protein CB0940_02871 [Cercospora beticola]|uniref:SCP domain-containing protein n=1 Tax=Cercospora beticola TaxID=122368 RepID=A0A2G5I2F2_CERBT|nr:hypothetical protein CB0940_02871 [Cercospora beticola]PIA98959.1 hypothetical protein CB0940_02871 [Cercospora beticola]WPB00024.1 hypothetical protein RHO25_004643 [Cercospora beticola]CAK1361800.1 unnamed protein product [Cercospora beticola]
MRSTLISAAFAAGALAVPAQAPAGYGAPQVDVQTAYDVVYKTEIVTVTAGGQPPAYTPESKPTHYGHKSKKPVTTTQEAAPPAYTPPTYEPAPKPETPAPAPSTPSGPASGSYADICLHHHNIHRANHSAPALVWSDELAATAKKIADTCVYEHNTEMDGGGYGQNIAAGVRGDNISAVITDLFYNAEEPAYALASGGYTSEPDMSNFHVWGHFSQIVWCGTTEVGCATSENCGSLGNTGSGVEPYFTVCNYRGPGNYAGKYTENVNAGDSNTPTAYWDAAVDAVKNAAGY